jgi:hypothetical protein
MTMSTLAQSALSDESNVFWAEWSTAKVSYCFCPAVKLSDTYSQNPYLVEVLPSHSQSVFATAVHSAQRENETIQKITPKISRAKTAQTL